MTLVARRFQDEILAKASNFDTVLLPEHGGFPPAFTDMLLGIITRLAIHCEFVAPRQLFHVFLTPKNIVSSD